MTWVCKGTSNVDNVTRYEVKVDCKILDDVISEIVWDKIIDEQVYKVDKDKQNKPYGNIQVFWTVDSYMPIAHYKYKDNSLDKALSDMLNKRAIIPLLIAEVRNNRIDYRIYLMNEKVKK